MDKEKVKFNPLVYCDWFHLFQSLSPEQSAEVLKGISGYPDYKVKDVPIWLFIKLQIDKQHTAFVERCEKAKIASNSRSKKTSNDIERYPIIETVTETGIKTEIETETVTETTNVTENDILKREKREKAKLGCRFENSEFYAENIPDTFFNVFDSVLKSDPEIASKGLDANRTYQSFRDYWISKSGKDATKVDWIATWRNWIRNEKPVQRQNRPLSKDEQDRVYFEKIRNMKLDDSWG